MKVLKKPIRLSREDKPIAKKLFRQIGDIIARNNDEGLELDFDFFVDQYFGIGENTYETQPTEFDGPLLPQ